MRDFLEKNSTKVFERNISSGDFVKRQDFFEYFNVSSFVITSETLLKQVEGTSTSMKIVNFSDLNLVSEKSLETKS